MKPRRQQSRQKTTSLNLVGKAVTITYVKHPLCGNKVTITNLYQEDTARITIKSSDGASDDIPLSWTDLMTSPEIDLSPELPQLLDVDCLLELAELIDGINQKPQVGKGGSKPSSSE